MGSLDIVSTAFDTRSTPETEGESAAIASDPISVMAGERREIGDFENSGSEVADWKVPSEENTDDLLESMDI